MVYCPFRCVDTPFIARKDEQYLKSSPIDKPERKIYSVMSFALAIILRRMSWYRRQVLARVTAIGCVFLAVAGCEPFDNASLGLDRYEDRVVTLPQVTLTPEQIGVFGDKVHVAAIRVEAAKSGSSVAARDIIAIKYQKRGREILRQEYARVHYRLKDDLELAARDALGYVFEVDPSSEAVLNVEIDLVINHIEDRTPFCAGWVSQADIRARLLFEWSDGMKIRQRSEATARRDACSGRWPDANVLAATIQDALLNLAAEIDSRRASATRTSSNDPKTPSAEGDQPRPR